MILRKIKQLLGMGSGSEESGRSEQDVVVQEERSSADTETESAVKGVDEGDSGGAVEESAATDEEPAEETTESDKATEPAEPEEEVGSGDVDEPVATDTTADASTESLVDEAEAQEHPASRAEPAEAAGQPPDDESIDVDAEDGDAEAEDVGAESEEGTDVDEIKGIGPAYSDRLAEADIHNVSQLAEADAADLAERTGVAEGTVQKWIDRAREFEE